MQPSESSVLGMLSFEGVGRIFSNAFNFDRLVIRNAHAVAITQTRAQLLGAPVSTSATAGKASLLTAANVTSSNIQGIIVAIDNDNGISAVGANSDSAVFATVLARGPAEFYDTFLRTVDAAGAALNMANVRTSLQAAGIRVIAKPVTESIQTT